MNGNRPCKQWLAASNYILTLRIPYDTLVATILTERLDERYIFEVRNLDKYEYRVKTEQLLEYAEKKQYRKAMEIADTIDWRRVKSASMLNTVSEVYEYCGEFQKSRDILFMAFDRSPGDRKSVV